MSNLNKECPFGNFPSWTLLDKYGKPSTDERHGFEQPASIKVPFKTPDSSRENTGYIVPDQAKYGPEWTISWTVEGLWSQVIDRHGSDKIDGKLRFQLFRMCLQGNAGALWDSIVAEKYGTPAVDHTVDNFIEAIADYLEKLSNVKYIGDSIIRALQTRKKPITMSPTEYRDRLTALYNLCGKPYIRSTLPIPTDQERKNLFYLAMPKQHRLLYALEHQEVTDSWESILQFFEGCAERDNSDGTFAKAWAGHAASCDAAAAKKSKTPAATHHDSKPAGGRRGKPTHRHNGYSSRSNYDRRDGRSRHDDRSYRRYEGKSRHAGRGHDVRYRERHHDRSDRDRKSDRGRERERQPSSKGGDKHRGRHESHHVASPSRSPSRSSSRSRSRSSDRSRSRSASRESSVASNYHVEMEDTSTVGAYSKSSDGKPKAKRHKSSRSKGEVKEQRWVSELDRPKVKRDMKGYPEGFGSFHLRDFGDYSYEEAYAPPGHKDRIRFRDLSRSDQRERVRLQGDDADSDLESDWEMRTGVLKKHWYGKKR